MKSNRSRDIKVLAYIILLILAWEGVSRLMASIFLPAPSEIVVKMFSPMVLNELYASFESLMIAFPFGVLIGLTLGFLVNYFPTFERSVLPVIYGIHSIPISGVAPILLFWIGVGPLLKIILGILIVFFPVAINTAAGLTVIGRGELMELMDSLKATKWQTFKIVRFPNALPKIFTGLKIAAPSAVIGVIVAELFAGNQGLGYLTVTTEATLEISALFATILWMSVFGLVLFGIISLIERLISPWYKRAGATQEQVLSEETE